MRTTLAEPKTMKKGWLALHAVGVMVTLRWALPRVNLPDLLQRLQPSRPPAYPDYPRFGKASQYIEVLLRRYPFPLSGQCLPRALMRYYFATRCGLPVRFHCGVCQDGDRLEGHAWITVDGRPFREAVNPETIYAITFSFPTRSDCGTAGQAVDRHKVD
jgi:hypothetical protein